MWSYGFDLRSNRLTVIKVVVSSEGTCNNCLFAEVWSTKICFSCIGSDKPF